MSTSTVLRRPVEGTDETLPASDSVLGLVLARRYRVVELIGVGSMGRVYRGERLGLGRRVAIKFLQEAYADVLPFRRRFERELKIMSRLDHPNCVSVIDYGFERSPYVVMDFIDGRTLSRFIADGVSKRLALELGRQLLCGLAHAHRLGVVHRDIKPANLIVSEATGTGPFLRIVDFGLAKLSHSESGDISREFVVGTPSYMSPEQAQAKTVDARSDVYCAGVVMYELLTGRKPFVAEDPRELLEMHRSSPPPPMELGLGEVDDPEHLEQIIMRALEKDPDDRYPSAMEFANALASCIPHASDELVVSAPRALSVKKAAKKVRRGLWVGCLGLLAFVGAYYAPELARAGRDGVRRLRADVEQSLSAPKVTAPGEVSVPAETSASPAPAAPDVPALADLAPAPDVPAAADLSPAPDAPAAADLAAAEPPIAADPNELDTNEAAEERPEAAEPSDDEEDVADLDANDEPEDLRTELSFSPVQVEPASPPSVREAERLIRAGEREAALKALETLAARQPKSAYLRYLRGRLYFEKMWWTDGLKEYAQAIALNRSYRRNGHVIRDAIRALSSRKTDARAARLLTRSIGRSALRALRRAAKNDKSSIVRRRAAVLAKRVGRRR